MTFDNQKIGVLVGPTGAGKTDLALEWVTQYPKLEIISVDSAMIYRGMDIGTAKPSAEILRKFPHHLIDIRDPSEAYSVAAFCLDCKNAVQDIFSRGKVPLLVGGTMMYLNALREGLANIPEIPPEIRQKFSEALNQSGIEALYQKLKKEDPISADRLKSTDTQRILRALEVKEATGIPLHEYWKNNQKMIPNPFVFLGIATEDRSLLHERIGKRTENMLKNGLIEEVRALYDRGDLHINLPAIRSLGYRQVWEYFLGYSSKNDLYENITISTRQLAKRQLTWMRSWSDIRWISSDLNLMELFSELF